MELYIGGTAQGKKVYVTQVRGIAEARIWDNFEEWFREIAGKCLEVSIPGSRKYGLSGKTSGYSNYLR